MAATVTSADYQAFGDWTPVVTCPPDYFMVQFRLRTQPGLGWEPDDIAVTDFNFVCRGPGLHGTSYTVLAGVGLDAGYWSGRSTECPLGSAICSVQVLMEDCADQSDCTTINTARFACCD